MSVFLFLFGGQVRNLLSNALKFTKSEGVIKMRVRSVNAITLEELIDTEEFQMFGKMPVWEMLNLAVINHQAAAAALDVEQAGERGDVVTDMAPSAAGGAPSSHHSVGSSMAARIRETRKSFSKSTGSRNNPSSSRDSTGYQEPSEVEIYQPGKEKPPSSNSNLVEDTSSKKSKGGGGSIGGSNRGSIELFSSAREMANALTSAVRRDGKDRDGSPIGSNEQSRENSGRLPLSNQGSRRGSRSDTGPIGGLSLPLSRVPSVRGDTSLEPWGGGGSKEGSKNTSRTVSPRNSDLRGSLDSSVVQEATRMIVIEVIDSGVGLTEDILPRIFNEVLQVNPGELQQGGGSGLGLMLTKGIVDQHGGKISVYSAGPNTGCTFTILLPMFKSGNQRVEERNREEANMFSRRVFINKFLEQNLMPKTTIPTSPSGNILDLSLDAPFNSPTNVKPRQGSLPNHAQKKVVPGYIRRNTAFDQLGAYIMRIAEVDDETESVGDNHAGLSISGRGENASLFDGGENEAGWAWRPGIGSKRLVM